MPDRECSLGLGFARAWPTAVLLELSKGDSPGGGAGPITGIPATGIPAPADLAYSQLAFLGLEP